MRKRRAIMHERRLSWEERWTSTKGASFTWDIDAVPDELLHLIELQIVPEGPALDLGCGASVVTSYLAQFFSPMIGVDLALDATQQARDLVPEDTRPPDFVVGDAVELPFASSSFSFVFDRGCLQNIPFELWRSYWRELDRVVEPGGYGQMFCSRPALAAAPLFSARGVRARMKRRMHGAKRKAHITPSNIERSLPSGFELVDMSEKTYETSGGHRRLMVFALFRKAAPITLP